MTAAPPPPAPFQPLLTPPVAAGISVVPFGPALLAGLRAVELTLVEGKVTEVLAVLEDQIATLKEQRFTSDAAIPTSSFGQGAESTTLAQEHTRAHGVVVASLEEMADDLVRFQDAIIEARQLLVDADEESEAAFTSTLRATNDLGLGLDAQQPADGQVP